MYKVEELTFTVVLFCCKSVFQHNSIPVSLAECKQGGDMGQTLLWSEFTTRFCRPGFPLGFVTSCCHLNWRRGGFSSNYHLVSAAS